jgi:hypothetical protein
MGVIKYFTQIFNWFVKQWSNVCIFILNQFWDKRSIFWSVIVILIFMGLFIGFFFYIPGTKKYKVLGTVIALVFFHIVFMLLVLYYFNYKNLMIKFLKLMFTSLFNLFKYFVDCHVKVFFGIIYLYLYFFLFIDNQLIKLAELVLILEKKYITIFFYMYLYLECIYLMIELYLNFLFFILDILEVIYFRYKWVQIVCSVIKKWILKFIDKFF